jgi:hypothetical protein
VDLAEARSLLERRVIELEQELDLLKLVLSLVEEELARAEAPRRGEAAAPPGARKGAEARPQGERAKAAGEREASPPEAKGGRAKGAGTPSELGRRLSEEILKSREGKPLARLAVHERGLVIEPLIEVPGDSPPFLNFLVVKVLNEYRRADERAARYGDIEPGERLDYAVEEDERGLVRRVVVWNWRERRRLEDIKGAVRWALARVLERGEVEARA